MEGRTEADGFFTFLKRFLKISLTGKEVSDCLMSSKARQANPGQRREFQRTINHGDPVGVMALLRFIILVWCGIVCVLFNAGLILFAWAF